MKARSSPSSPGDASAGPRALPRLLGLFEAIASAPDGLTLADLNAALASPKSSLLLLLRPLVASGHLRHDAGRYRLGPAAYRFAETLLRGRQPAALVLDALQEAWEASGETVILAKIDRQARVVTYVDCRDSPMLIRYSVPSGEVRPLYCSAAGQVLLAFQSPAWQREYLDGTALQPLTPHTIVERDLLERRLQQIRGEGISISDNEAVPGAAGLGVPVQRPSGVVDEALLVAGPAERIRRRVPELRALMLGISHRLAAALGSTPASPEGSAAGASRGTSGRLPSPPAPQSP